MAVHILSIIEYDHYFYLGYSRSINFTIQLAIFFRNLAQNDQKSEKLSYKNFCNFFLGTSACLYSVKTQLMRYDFLIQIFPIP